MKQRIKSMYIELYKEPRSKDFFAKLFDVSTKTIENTVANYGEDFFYDRSIGAYRFKTLLPKLIPYEVFFNIFGKSILNQIIKTDFQILEKAMSEVSEEIPMLQTQNLSPLAKKVIQAHVAIHSNCTLIIDYIGNNDRGIETKYIKPHKIISTGFTYYLYSSYIKENEKNIGEFRSLAVNGISQIAAYEYKKGEKFFIEGEGNAYGLYTKDKFVTLLFEFSSANYFKREGMFNSSQFDLVSEEADGSIIGKMYFNNIQEVIKLLQQWMPQIKLYGQSEIITDIHDRIKSNFEKFYF